MSSRWALLRWGEGSYIIFCLSLHRPLHDVFSVYNLYPKWIEENQKLIDSMGLKKDEQYFSELDKISIYEDRLKFLSGKEKNDRIYLLRLVGKWMREDAAQALASKRLQQIYPELYAYLDGGIYDSDLARYFALYKAYKLENSLPADEALYFSGIQADAYDYRYAVLSNLLSYDCVVLWIDALGAEWLPLLRWTLMQADIGTVKDVSIVQPPCQRRHARR